MEKKLDLWSIVEELNEDQKSSIHGGACGCFCAWSSCGGSSSHANLSANDDGGFVSHQDCCDYN